MQLGSGLPCDVYGNLCRGARCNGFLLQKALSLEFNQFTFFLPRQPSTDPLSWFLLRQQQLWHAYLEERYEAARHLRITDAAHLALNNTFERALVTMHKMPKIWELYLNFLVEQQDVTSVRQTSDRALASLPVTQHDRIWTIYLVSMP